MCNSFRNILKSIGFNSDLTIHWLLHLSQLLVQRIVLQIRETVQSSSHPLCIDTGNVSIFFTTIFHSVIFFPKVFKTQFIHKIFCNQDGSHPDLLLISSLWLIFLSFSVERWHMRLCGHAYIYLYVNVLLLIPSLPSTIQILNSQALSLLPSTEKDIYLRGNPSV